jgi:hypothetical protein
MAVTTLRQSAQGTMTNETSSSWSATFASVPNVGSLLVAVVSFQQTSGGARIPSLPAGWTKLLPGLAQYYGLASWIKLAGSSEPTTVTVTVDPSTGLNNGAISIAEFEGDFDASSISGATYSAGSYLSGQVANTTPSLSTTAERSLILPCICHGGNSGTLGIIGGTIYRAVFPGTSDFHRAQAAAWADEQPAGSQSATFSWSTATGSASGIFALPLVASAVAHTRTITSDTRQGVLV